jgi:formylmethanofuran dehydrogenase subunit E
VAGPLKTQARKQPEAQSIKGASALLFATLQYAKVRVRNVEGRYLTSTRRGWKFSSDLSEAAVLDYQGDETKKQLALLAQIEDFPLEVIPVEPKDFLEICDKCHRMVSPTAMRFDGKRFLCSRCNRPRRDRR